PPIFPRPGHATEPAQLGDMKSLTLRALARPVAYRSAEAFAAQLRQRRAFSRWVAGEHLLFAQSTLRQHENGEWILRCPRELEARIFATNNDPTLWPKLANLKVPTILIGADTDDPQAGPPARISRAIHEEIGLDYAMIEGTTHFLQFEQPLACRDALLAFLRRQKLMPMRSAHSG